METTLHETEKRSHPRFNPKGLTAHIVIDLPSAEEIVLDGEIIDMSYTGIKIKLHAPLTIDIEQAEIRISLHMPESGVPVTIHGKIKHLRENSECGLHYGEKHGEEDVDDLLFECVKWVPHGDQSPSSNV